MLDYKWKFSSSAAVPKPIPLSHKTAEKLYKKQFCFQPDFYYEFELQGPPWTPGYNIISHKGDM